MSKPSSNAGCSGGRPPWRRSFASNADKSAASNSARKSSGQRKPASVKYWRNGLSPKKLARHDGRKIPAARVGARRLRQRARNNGPAAFRECLHPPTNPLFFLPSFMRRIVA